MKPLSQFQSVHKWIISLYVTFLKVKKVEGNRLVVVRLQGQMVGDKKELRKWIEMYLYGQYHLGSLPSRLKCFDKWISADLTHECEQLPLRWQHGRGHVKDAINACAFDGMKI